MWSPHRLKILKACQHAAGVVLEVEGEPDGDHHIWFAVDKGFESLLNGKNRILGRPALLAEITPECPPSTNPPAPNTAAACPPSHLPIPGVGEHIAVDGPWVFDVNHGWNEIHPVQAIVRLRLVPVGLDAEGYGFPEHDRTLARLVDDIRVMGPAGVERAAQGWDDFAAGSRHARYHEAERAATHALEQNDRGAAWDTLRSSLFGLTESGQALISWKAEHGEVGHKAEDAAFGAALGLVASDLIGPEQYETLVRPMGEALPWLIPEVRP